MQNVKREPTEVIKPVKRPKTVTWIDNESTTCPIVSSSHQVPLVHEEQKTLFGNALREQQEKKAILISENNRLYNLRAHKYTESDADPIIKKHAIHWLICIETYQPIRKIHLGEKLDWELIYQNEETCVYSQIDHSNIIIGFRGTKTKKDLYDDTLLSFGKIFPRTVEAKQFTQKMMKENPRSKFQTTGHSLGGAIARVVCKDLGIQAVTFNAASPPTSPVTSCFDSKDYHIVYDVISAWQSPNTVRIDKGFNPVASWWQRANDVIWLYYSFSDIIESHNLNHFSNERKGDSIPAIQENQLWKKWWSTLPPMDGTGVLGLLLGNLTQLPTIT